MSDNPSEQSPETLESRSLADRVLKAGIVIAVAHLMAKVFGFVQARTIGHYYGSGEVNDIFVFVFEGILLSLFFIGEEAIGPAFLPLFMKSKETKSEKDAWAFASTLMNLQVIILGIGVALLMIFPDWFLSHGSRFLKSSTKQLSDDRFQMAVEFLFYMAPALFGFSIGSLTYMLLNGYKRFFWAAFADGAWKLALVVGFFAARSTGGMGEKALTIGVLAAGFAKLLIHGGALFDKLRYLRLRIQLNDPVVKRFGVLILPLLFGIVFAKVRDFYNYYYVVSGIEGGMLTTMAYGRKIFNAFDFLVPYSLSIAMFPFFCELVARDDKNSLGKFLTDSSRMLLVLLVPVSAVLAIMSVPLSSALFQTGKFSAESAKLAGLVSVCFCLMLPFSALEKVMMQAYFANQKTISVVIIGLAFSTLSMVITGVGVLYLGYTGPTALMIIALGFAVSRSLKAIVLIGLLKASIPFLPFVETMRLVVRTLLLGAACAGAAYGALIGVEVLVGSTDVEGIAGMKVLLKKAPQLAAAGIAAVIVFWSGCKALGLRELDEMVGYAKQKFKRKKKE